jgi:hypothetical protein
MTPLAPPFISDFFSYIDFNSETPQTPHVLSRTNSHRPAPSRHWPSGPVGRGAQTNPCFPFRVYLSRPVSFPL